MSTYQIDLHDRAGALERLLNKCRRKGYDIISLQFGPSELPGMHRVIITFGEGCPPAVRLVPNLARVYDVHAVEAAASEASASSPLARTRAA